MASAPTASSFSAPTSAAAAPGSSLLPALGAAQAPGSPQSGDAQTADGFLQLFAGMINAKAGNTPAPVPTTTPQDLATLPFECDANSLLDSLEPTENSDKNTDDKDADGEDAGALAVAALLPGLVQTPALLTSGAASATAEGAPVDVAALTTARLAVEMSDAAVEDLKGDTADAAGNTPLPSPDSPAQAAPQPAVTTNAHMHVLLNSHAAAADATADVVVQSPVGTPEWKEEVGTQITWMAVNGREAASLRLSPEHLGPVEVRISVDDGKASVYFGAANADTRSALEQSLPRLRELFATQGLVLADAGVSRDAPRNQFKPSASPSFGRGSSDAPAEVSVTSVTFARAGLIDTYV